MAETSGVSQAASGCAISLHLGAHKTATTWVQTRLAGSRDHLATLGLGYEPLEAFRAHVTDPIAGALHRPAERTALLAAADARIDGLLAGPTRRFIASDENLIGHCQAILQTGRLYPWLPQLIGVLAQTRLMRADRVVLTIRDYASFLPSAYGEAIRWVDFVPFDLFRERLDLTDGMWLRVIGELIGFFGRDRLRVMRYEALPERLGDFLLALTGIPLDPTRLAPSDVFRQGLSGEAVAALAEIARAEGPARPRAVVDEVARRLPRAAGRPGFMPWSDAERTRLHDLYATHLAEIEARWPGLLI